MRVQPEVGWTRRNAMAFPSLEDRDQAVPFSHLRIRARRELRATAARLHGKRPDGENVVRIDETRRQIRPGQVPARRESQLDAVSTDERGGTRALAAPTASASRDDSDSQRQS
jgi:hypothetical protein